MATAESLQRRGGDREKKEGRTGENMWGCPATVSDSPTFSNRLVKVNFASKDIGENKKKKIGRGGG